MHPVYCEAPPINLPNYTLYAKDGSGYTLQAQTANNIRSCVIWGKSGNELTQQTIPPPQQAPTPFIVGNTVTDPDGVSIHESVGLNQQDPLSYSYSGINTYTDTLGATVITTNLESVSGQFSGVPMYGAPTVATIACPELCNGMGAASALAPEGGEAAASAAKATPFAMGLEGDLDAFAKARSATTYKDFLDQANWRSQVFNKLSDPNTPVHFNLNGVDIWGGVIRAASGSPYAGARIGSFFKSGKTHTFGIH